MAGFSQYLVRLHRDSLNTPWGFRLQGGKDVGQPLSVQRVFSGTAAEGDLQRGDLIVAIENKSTENLTHKQAQDCIKAAGGSILLQIRRPPAGTVLSPLSPQPRTLQPSFRPAQSQPQPMAFSSGHRPTVQRQAYGGPGPQFGVDYSKRGGPMHSPGRQASDDHYMLNRVQQSLDNALLSPVGGRYDPDSVITTPQYIPQKDVPMYHQNQQPAQHQPAYQQPTYHHQQQHQQKVVFQQQQQPSEPFRPFSQQQIPVQYQQAQQQNNDDEDEYEHLSVSERKLNFMKKDVSPQHIHPSHKRPVGQPPRATPQDRQPQFGIDYSRGQHHRPPPEPVHRPFFSPQPPTPEHPHTSQDVFVPGKPAWRGSLKKSGNKPWQDDKVLEETYASAPQKQPLQVAPKPQKPRSVPIRSERSLPVNAMAAPVGQMRSIPIKQTPTQHGRTRSEPIQKSWKPHEPEPEPSQKSPRVMHLQYNSPINIYSRANVNETLVGQVGHVTPTKTQQKVPFGKEPRDWEQSAVYKMVHGDSRSHQAPAREVQHGDQQYQHAQQSIDDEIGISDF